MGIIAQLHYLNVITSSHTHFRNLHKKIYILKEPHYFDIISTFIPTIVRSFFISRWVTFVFLHLLRVNTLAVVLNFFLSFPELFLLP